jgi:hypothetical protein
MCRSEKKMTMDLGRESDAAAWVVRMHAWVYNCCTRPLQSVEPGYVLIRVNSGPSQAVPFYYLSAGRRRTSSMPMAQEERPKTCKR